MEPPSSLGDRKTKLENTTLYPVNTNTHHSFSPRPASEQTDHPLELFSAFKRYSNIQRRNIIKFHFLKLNSTTEQNGRIQGCIAMDEAGFPNGHDRPGSRPAWLLIWDRGWL